MSMAREVMKLIFAVLNVSFNSGQLHNNNSFCTLI